MKRKIETVHADDQQFCYRHYDANGKLSKLVSDIWLFENFTDEDKVFKIFPDACLHVSLIFTEGKITSSLLRGFWDEPLKVVMPARSQRMGIRFLPLSIDGIFQQSLSSLMNNVCPFELKDININSDELANAWGNNLCAESFFKRILENGISEKYIDKREEGLYDMIKKSEGGLSIKEIANNVGISSRHLNRRVAVKTGMNIKKYSQIVRFYSRVKKVKQSSLTPSNSYTDQSHFIKEVKKFTGFTPKKLLEQDDTEYLQLYCYNRVN